MTRSKAIDPDNPIASVRQLTGLSQRQTAERMGMDQSLFSKTEKRHSDTLYLGTLKRVCAALGFELELRVRPKDVP